MATPAAQRIAAAENLAIEFMIYALQTAPHRVDSVAQSEDLCLSCRRNGVGVDDLAGYAVQSIVLQVPESNVTRDGKSVSSDMAANAVVGARYDATEIMQGVTEVLAYGTAVYVEPAK